MKQIVILSGKGGTGKTTVTASFAALAQNAVLVDADVDAADLHLLLKPENTETHEFSSGQEATIDPERCTACGICRDLCRFDAIDEDFRVDPFACEGCGLCASQCPEGAAVMRPTLSGHWFRSQSEYGPFIHAKLGIAAENSGKLVAVVREEARNDAEAQNRDLILIDGPPGVGCPVIASITGCDLAFVVTEPTKSGLHDLERVVGLAKHFKIPAFATVNKADLDEEMAGKIETACHKNGVKTLGRIPFDPAAVKSVVAGARLVEYSSGAAAMAIRDIWRKLSYELELLDAP